MFSKQRMRTFSQPSPRRVPAGGAAALVVAVVSVGVALGQPVGGVDVLVNQDPPPLTQNEVALTLNPTRPGNLVMVYNDNPVSGGPGIGVSFSYNTGVTWTDRQLTVPGMSIHFDPMAAADMLGTVYAGCIATDAAGTTSGLYVWSSNDGGNTWAGPVQVSFDQPPTQTLNDRGHLIVDTHPTSPFFNYVYVTWIRDIGTTPNSDLWFSSSPPGGTNFTPRTRINDPTGGCTQGSCMGHAPHLAAAADGTLYATWTEYDVLQPSQTTCKLWFDVSYDGGVTWGPDQWIHQRTFITVPKQFSDSFPGSPGVKGDTAPCIAVHPTNPREIYIVWPEDPDGPGVGDEGDIYCISSYDGGVIWGPPILVGPGPICTGHDFAPWVDVKPNGLVDVAWYHGGFADEQPILWCVAMLQSADQGNTWTGPGMVSDTLLPAPFDPWMFQRWLGEYLALVVDRSWWTYYGQPWAYLGFTTSAADQYGDIYYDNVNNPTFSDCDSNGIPDFADLAMGTHIDLNGNGVPDLCEAWLAEFSLDIGSDSELSDPFRDGDEGFDPGDIYWWGGPRVICPGGRDGFLDDVLLYGFDPWPDPPDPAYTTAVPVGNGSPWYYDYLDVDGHDQLDISLYGGPPFPLPAATACAYPPEYLMISFDDDMALGWPQFDVPVSVPSPAGVSSYGTTGGRDEVLGVTVAVQPTPPPYPIANQYPIADEFTVHQNLAPNPDQGDPEDDDVDSLDIHEGLSPCTEWYFTVDHEAHIGLDPGDIYQVLLGGGPVAVIDDVIDLGISDETDIDAFEFTLLAMPDDPTVPMFAMIYSVDDDDPLTPGDESGGLNPNQLYVSWMTGYSMDFSDPLDDDIDALTIWIESLELGACCYFVPAVGYYRCVVTDSLSCLMQYQGTWQGPGTDCTDADLNGIADVCDLLGACCYSSNPLLCGITTEQYCLTGLNGLWQGAGTDCTWCDDCNSNNIPDHQDLANCDGSPWCDDCNTNGVLDVCDIAAGTSPDCNTNGMPDECEAGVGDVTMAGGFIGKIFELDPPYPLGSGSTNPETMRNGDYPPVGSMDYWRQYDTFHNGDQGNEDWMGYEFTYAREFHSLTFQEGMHFVDGGWFDTLQVQVRVNGLWTNVANLSSNPNYPGNNGVNFETFILTFDPLSGDAIRIYGDPGGSANFIGFGEYRVQATYHPTFDCNSNGVLDECDIAAGTSADCNTNGVPDECDIAAGTSADTNSNGVPDECETCPGDANCDGQINWRDIDYFVAAQNDNYAAWAAMFLPGSPTCPFANNDANADGTANWRDIDPFVALMNTTCP
ncbi:MAG: exo-alpha-sialidase [Phycisphaerae bacterium]|nr:exo-alpha-sialidase [Phycisphaerae bacterium]